MTRIFLALCAGLTLSAGTAPAAGKPLKVYILAGQANMAGMAKVETLDHLADDPATVPLLAKMRQPNGTPRVYDRVRVSYLTGVDENLGEAVGPLTTGFGGRKSPFEPEGKIGPELTFGITMQENYDGRILIIKTAWSTGLSLYTDFRPPSAGPFEITPAMRDGLAKLGKGPDSIQTPDSEATGKYYRLMIEHVKTVLADPGRVHPGYDPTAGVELAGFVWFQGWNDMTNPFIYPDRDQPGGYAMYTELLADLIRDVRKDLDAPKLPFVIGVMGVGGSLGSEPKSQDPMAVRNFNVHTNFRAAMAVPADMPEFRGNVVAVQTSAFWPDDLKRIDDKLGEVRDMAGFLKAKDPNHANKDGQMTSARQKQYVADLRVRLITSADDALWQKATSGPTYVYLGSGKVFALMGQGFARALIDMKK